MLLSNLTLKVSILLPIVSTIKVRLEITEGAIFEDNSFSMLRAPSNKASVDREENFHHKKQRSLACLQETDKLTLGSLPFPLLYQRSQFFSLSKA